MTTETLVQAGDAAPDIELPTADGGVWRLDGLRGRPVVLIFHRHLH